MICGIEFVDLAAKFGKGVSALSFWRFQLMTIEGDRSKNSTLTASSGQPISSLHLQSWIFFGFQPPSSTLAADKRLLPLVLFSQPPSADLESSACKIAALILRERHQPCKSSASGEG